VNRKKGSESTVDIDHITGNGVSVLIYPTCCGIVSRNAALGDLSWQSTVF